ncbi:Rkm2p [Sugiyamaella lignohabitans]|uniref:Rkm2p n=1 Tax=Sugiyamaella lignohabitans TaxID=796027 RepID=A0A167CG50_9ASCO|nr:Rkm2p [Sugiyamaella lignohabitans]ANB11644.1 Rkm2p [Sugiyamaella lignohabitans]
MASNLETWLKKGNAVISPKIAVQDIPGRGRSVISTQAITPGTQLVVIRRRQLLNKLSIKVTCPKWTPHWNKLNSHQILALVITLYCNDADNYWYPFLSQLPTKESFQGIPLGMTPEDLKSMPLSVQSHVSKQKNTFLDDFEAVKRVLSDSDSETNIEYNEFLRAWMCVNSRCLYMTLPGSDGTPADNMTMAPFIDFLNHTSLGEQDSVKVDVTAVGMVVTARKHYSPGDEILLGYGPHDNTFLLCEYGFTIPSNPWDTVDITQEILQLLTTSQKSVLEELGYLGDYTVNKEGPSFRTEVSLSCLQEPSSDGIPPGLQMLCSGRSDGSKYKTGNCRVLQQILETKSRELARLPLNDVTRGMLEITNALTNEK